MKYMVVFFEAYVGYHFNEHSRVFEKEAKAWRYCRKLNKEFAKENGCEVADLGDCYVMVKVKEEK